MNQQEVINTARSAADRFRKHGQTPTVKACPCLDVIEEAIADSKKSAMGGIPSGHVYAAVMGMLSLDEYQSILAVLKAEGKIRIEGSHLIRWIAK